MAPSDSLLLATSLLIRHGPLLAMLATAVALRRSLGSWPVYLTVLILVAGAQFAITAIRGQAPGMAVAVEMMAMPTLLFALARRQLVPGLRRGQMSDADRARWVARHALRPRSSQHHNALAHIVPPSFRSIHRAGG